jgi:hypothetical protein
MNQFTTMLARGLTQVAVFGLAIAGAAYAQEPVQFTEVTEVAATVAALDSSERMITLRGPRGVEMTIEAGPDVRNFAQIEVGDTVRVHYELVYGAQLVDPEAVPEQAAAAAAGMARAEEGERPGGVIGMIEAMVVLIESIGPGGRTATFITPEGSLQAIVVRHEEARAFARELAAGDLVQLTVAEAVAIFVEPIAP